MRKQVLLILSGILLCSGSAFYFSRQYDPAAGDFSLETKGPGKGTLDKQRDAMGAMQWRYNKLKDENGNFNASYYQNAIAQADVLQQYGSRSALGLQWQELGPDNVGGRTRSIVIDKRDPTRNTIYAGGVSGGMWKSLDGGNTWNRLTGWTQWLAVSCIIQGPAPSYTIYVGTGEGFGTYLASPIGYKFDSGSVGDGIFTIDDNDDPQPFAFNDNGENNTLNNDSIGVTITRIAVDPQNDQQFVVATGHGLFLSIDSGATWTEPTLPNIPKGEFADDVKWASDGGNIFASIGSPLEASDKLVMSPDGGQSWYEFTSTKNPGFPATQVGRIEIAIAPSNPDYVYLLIATPLGVTYGLYSTNNAVDNGTGCTWNTLATYGPLFDPFNTGEDQGWYDNTIAVNPFNPTEVCMGGVNFYTWGSLSGAQDDDAGLGGGAVNPYYIHPDKHTIVYSDVDSNVMFVGCDGGIYKSTDAASAFPYPTFSVINSGYNVTQNYSIGAAITGEVMGGAQDNGTNYINYKGNTAMAATEVLGGDGSYSEFSHLAPNVSFAGIYYGEYYRSGNYTASFTDFFDGKIDPQGWTQPSGCDLSKSANAPFISDLYLAETRTADSGLTKVPFVADQIYNIGDIISLESNTGSIPFQDTLRTPLAPGDTLLVNDPIRSRVFLSSYCGTWVTSQALDISGIPKWYQLMGNDKMTGTPDSYAATGDGDVLYVGTDAGLVYRFHNLNARCDTTTYPGGDVAGVLYPTSNLYSYTLVASGRDVEGLSVDPNNENHVAAVIAGFSSSNQPHVYESQNGGQTWVADTGGLPNMPVYDVVIHDANTIIIASELGIWSWDGSSWHEENNGGLPRVPCYRLIEKELYNSGCQVLYLGTHGRGMWRSTTLTAGGCQLTPGMTTGVTNISAPNISGLNIFPNPVNSSSKILSLDNNSTVIFRVFDMTGKLCKEISQQNAITGENLYPLNVSGLSSGTYLLSATVANTRTESRLFTVTK